MSFKSIATILHNPKTQAIALEFAIRAAQHWNAHLHVVCAGVDSDDPGFYYAGEHAITVQENLEHTEFVASKLEVNARDRLEAEDIAWDVEAVTVTASGMRPFLAEQMRYFDLAILPLPYGKNRTGIDVEIFETCIFRADIPVLVVPERAEWKTLPSLVLVAWDNSTEALAAARAATPMTDAAEMTEIHIINPPVLGPDRSDPGGRLAQMLVRSGAKVEVSVAAKLRSNIGDQLLRHAVETGADVIVMGAYGHSRLREAVLGGVTRSMLQRATVPILMAH